MRRRKPYAWIESFLSFDTVVPLEGPAGAYEAIARKADPARRGLSLQGRSVREVDPADLAAIVRAGLRETLSPANARRLELDPVHADADMLALVQAPIVEQERRIEQVLSNRKIRDAAFRGQVIDCPSSKHLGQAEEGLSGGSV